MRDCSKCGSYVPEGKLCCPACGRLCVGLSTDAGDRVKAERKQTYTRISDGFRQVKRDAPLQKRGHHPYAGGTYEQHKSHDPASKDYYKSKYESDASGSMNHRVLCAAAYFGIFFLVPLFAMPNSEEGRFHANQGLILFLFGIALGVAADMLSLVLGDLFDMLGVVYPLLMVYGAANAMKGSMTELPVIGKLRLIKGDSDFGGFR